MDIRKAFDTVLQKRLSLQGKKEDDKRGNYRVDGALKNEFNGKDCVHNS